uniref:DUF4743 domain-containing protein n=1 Tax=Oncorhynchus mykiss TaxID=8022 RepID=A0A8C7PJV4_ONCMY
MFIFVTGNICLCYPGSSRTTFLRFGVGGEQVGRVPCKSGVHFEYISNLFNPPHGGAISLCQNFDSFRREGSLTVLEGWRDEMRGKNYEVMPRVCDTPLIPRSAPLSLKRYGHTYPVKLDILVSTLLVPCFMS